MRTKTFENSKTNNFYSLSFVELNELSKNKNGDDPFISIFTKIQAINAFYRALLMTDAGINTNRIQ